MPNILCDSCNRNRALDLYWHPSSNVDRPGDSVRGVFICGKCHGRSPFEFTEATLTFKPGKQLLTPLNDTVPADVQERYTEAQICLYAGAFRASAVMARASVEQALEARGVSKPTLDAQIKEALSQQIIGDEQSSIAHGSRLIGNDAVHAGPSISAGEVPAVIAAAAGIINHLL